MTRAHGVAFALVVLVACSDQSDRPLVRAAPASTAPTATTATVPAPASTAPPPTTTTTLASSAAKAVITRRGIVVPVIGKSGPGWRVRTPCGKDVDLAGGTPIERPRVVLDPGHGGNEPGAVGANRLTEAVLNLAVAKQTKAALERAGVTTVLARAGEYQVSLATRTDLVMALRPDAFVSIHHNAEPDGPWPRPGTETYYQIGSGSSKRLAGLIWEEVVQALSAYQLPWVADRDAGTKYRRGENGDYYFVLRKTAGVPSALAELAFITNPPEAELLARPDVQRVEGEAVARGIVRYLTTNDPGSGFTEPYPRVTPAGGPGPPCTDPPL